MYRFNLKAQTPSPLGMINTKRFSVPSLALFTQYPRIFCLLAKIFHRRLPVQDLLKLRILPRPKITTLRYSTSKGPQSNSDLNFQNLELPNFLYTLSYKSTFSQILRYFKQRMRLHVYHDLTQTFSGDQNSSQRLKKNSLLRHKKAFQRNQFHGFPWYFSFCTSFLHFTHIRPGEVLLKVSRVCLFSCFFAFCPVRFCFLNFHYESKSPFKCRALRQLRQQTLFFSSLDL